MKLEEELQTWGWEGESCENDEAGYRNVVHANEIQPTGGWMCWKQNQSDGTEGKYMEKK